MKLLFHFEQHIFSHLKSFGSKFIINSLRSKQNKVVHFVILVHQVKVNFPLLCLKYLLKFSL
jgi:hypothetical protein